MLSHAAHPGLLIAFFVGYLTGCAFAQWLAIIPTTGISIWPPIGLFLATLLLTPRTLWPSIALTAIGAELVGNALWFANPLHVALFLSFGNVLAAVAGASMIRVARGSQPFQLDGLRDVIVLTVFGAVLSPIVSATVGAATLSWAEGQPIAKAWGLWWVGDATGVLIVAPIALVALRHWREPIRLVVPRALELLVVIGLLAFSAMFSLSSHLPFAYVIMPPLLWAALRFEFKGAILALVPLTVMTAAFTTSGVSPFSGDASSQTQRHVMLQLFLAISALSTLLVAALAREHRLTLLSLQQANDQLEQRVATRTADLHESETRLRAALGESRRNEERQSLLLYELQHRVKNTLAIVQSVAMQSFRNTNEREAVTDFVARLAALARGHDVLAQQSWEGADLGEIVRRSIAAHSGGGPSRFAVEGPQVWMSPRQSLAITLALHELCTNAAKYGALSVAEGEVGIHWKVDEERGRFQITWRESKGPPVRAPKQHGFGVRLLERGLKHDLGGGVELDFVPDGLVCIVDAPLADPAEAFQFAAA